MNLRESFRKNGYVVLNLYNKKDLLSLKHSLALLINNTYKRNNLKMFHNAKNLDSTVNKGMIHLEKLNHKYLADIYDTLPQSTAFYKIINSEKIINRVKYLLGIDQKKTNLYINSMQIRMDTPGVTKYSGGWHADQYTNIAGSNFIQSWAPLCSTVDENSGALKVALESHLTKVKTNHNIFEKKRLGTINRVKYYGIKFIKKKFKTKAIKLRLGQALLFKKNLYHKSGIVNNKNKMRYAILAFYHDVNTVNFKYQNMKNY